MKKDNSRIIQDELQKLDPWNRGQVMLLTAFLDFTDEQMDLVKSGVALMLGWHQKQHPSSKRCDKCETMERLIVMYQMVEEIYTTSKSSK